ncbi:RNA polymerase sigma factor [Nocardiopsis ganjiahuensis]|uniref:hypothetical protein n=1 Tax=Nocardiopsis ganjiahuensis TaxID=239984 RepID=UPI00034A2073|nr:hypothetical protein [Nocardiopsis ganjiahuensis]
MDEPDVFDFDWIQQIADPLAKTKTAHHELSRFQEATNELQRLRREGVEALQADGWKPREIADHLDVSRQRIEQIGKNGPSPAGAFFGRGTVTIAMGEKIEAPKDSGKSGPAVATEDLAAYEILGRLARDLKLEVSFEAIKPPGVFDTNRSSLIVVCGPRLSPVVAQLLAGDTRLGFDNDDQGWYLENRETQEVFRSPMNKGVKADYAYLGRLPRLDGKGSFTYIAGIHSIGATGVTHWLTNNLNEIYAEVGPTKLFSTLIRCDYEDTPLKVTKSERVAPIYLRQGDDE